MHDPGVFESCLENLVHCGKIVLGLNLCIILHLRLVGMGSCARGKPILLNAEYP